MYDHMVFSKWLGEEKYGLAKILEEQEVDQIELDFANIKCEPAQFKGE